MPPMDWSSWNKFGCNIGDQLIRDVADVISANGMRDAGHQYITVDDCWRVARSANGTIPADTVRFSSGIGAMTDYVHSSGLNFDIFTDAGYKTCEGRPGSYGAYPPESRMLSGFMSRCTMPRECAYASADATSRSQRRLSCSGGVPDASRLRNDSPST